MSNTAYISDCGKYRYTLSRVVNKHNKGTLLFIMLNPSTADADTNDNTIVRCMDYTNRFGYAQLDVVNLFAYRVTDSKKLLSIKDPVGLANDSIISYALGFADEVVCAWGSKGLLNSRDDEVLSLIKREGIKPACLIKNADGTPGHPLHLSKELLLKPYIKRDK